MFAAVIISKQESNVSISFSSEHVSQLCPSSILTEGVCLVSKTFRYSCLVCYHGYLYFTVGLLGRREGCLCKEKVSSVFCV